MKEIINLLRNAGIPIDGILCRKLTNNDLHKLRTVRDGIIVEKTYKDILANMEVGDVVFIPRFPHQNVGSISIYKHARLFDYTIEIEKIVIKGQLFYQIIRKK